MTHKKFLLLFVSSIGFSFGLFTTPADASVYANKSNTTRVAIYEQVKTAEEKLEGEYFTNASGRTWVGDISLKATKGNTPGHQKYIGTFSDFTTGPATTLTCKGDVTVTIIRAGIALKNQKQIIINWTVKGGDKCPSIGQKFSMTLAEAFPIPDKNGNFMSENADDWNGGTQNSTWDSWRVVAEGLNCRTTPQGGVHKIYKKGDIIVTPPNDRNGSALVGSDGKIYPFKGEPWLRTKDSCYVRANSQYIQPASNPF
ncbi:hypothetical protein [Planktothrix agardhii]|jgi:hypothetical protein|uniref:hypothetical protein n=1 Tax=Planktothrix agardhii TaxID=1160 RepID=UPI001F33E86A|nr:hypothetical protein [Planktothrix agardhii]MCF3578887.1 hypothetical protein [Planktothrix agardhii 1812]MCF3614320.1 hypothetical protein [Planktothrix agardhii 1027]MCF3648077.1 hypothetical protein [Planktothrix agardhii 1026]